jgi:hypothetical protein
MSLMPEPKQSLPAVIGEMEELLGELAGLSGRARDLLDRVSGMGFTPRPAPDGRKIGRYAQLDPLSATRLFMDETGHPVTEKEIIEELLDGKVREGSKKMEPQQIAGNIKRSLFANSRKKDSPLKKIGDLYGLRDWPPEKFKS